MNSVGIDISKGRSTVAVMRPFGEVVISPFEVHHTDSELSALARRLKSLNGETRVGDKKNARANGTDEKCDSKHNADIEPCLFWMILIYFVHGNSSFVFCFVC